MNRLSTEGSQQPQNRKRRTYTLLLPLSVLAIYAILSMIAPDKAFSALKGSGSILLHVAGPLALVFLVMLLLNLFVKPAQIAKYLGKGASAKGIILSAAAGIISTGPIYAWYPLLKNLREKGAGNFALAVFLYNRAVKPFLLPVMIAYFGWEYVSILTLFTILGSLAVGYSMTLVMKGNDQSSDGSH